MALPLPNSIWPPPLLEGLKPAMNAWSAWYSGDPVDLREVYQIAQPANFDRPSQRRGGVVGAIARFWWGRPLTSGSASAREDQIHVPIAADLCQASSDLMYAEPPTILADSPKESEAPSATQMRIEAHIEGGLFSDLAAGAEVGAALGGRYHRVTWDNAVVPGRPFLTTIDADTALPEFRWGKLVGVTFWYVLSHKGQEVIRHVERHELATDGTGLVFHGLYTGTPVNLGSPLDLAAHPDTAGLADKVDAEGAIIEGRTPGLLVEYVPNQTPQRRKAWRKHSLGRYLGRSDLDGIESEMDALDETYSSLMRDLRLAKSRILIPEYMMSPNAPGAGAAFDMDRDVYVPIKSAAPEDGDASITLNQFAIRVTDHLALCQELTEVILRSAGYSSQTFGENEGGGGAVTATEIVSRERRSYLTRDRKIRHEKPAVARIMQKLLSIDAAVFAVEGLDFLNLPTVTFGDAVQESPLILAQTAQFLFNAQAASTQTLVSLVHPDWDETRVKDEADLITGAAEDAAPADPFAPFGG